MIYQALAFAKHISTHQTLIDWKVRKIYQQGGFKNSVIMRNIMSKAETFPKVNKRGGRGWEAFPIMNKQLSLFDRELRVDCPRLKLSRLRNS